MVSDTCADRPTPNPLPIEERLTAIREALLEPGSTVLLQAPPGAGKTTRVPLALLDCLGEEGRILLLEPRRLAAVSAAQRLAAGLAEAVGDRVGYRIRMESRTSVRTILDVMTTGLFLRRLQSDPGLEGVSCVIFDEFHERGSEADLALALVRQARALVAPDLRLLVMSATLDLEPLARELDGARVITSEGRSHPVEIQHLGPREGESLAAHVIRAVEGHWLPMRQRGETVLVFLPGNREISSVQRAIASRQWSADVACCPLHGMLPLAAQEKAISPEGTLAGKVVLATAIAESSLTIQAVRLVIDAGWSRRSRFDPSTGMDALVTLPSSQASAEQRAGRAGRLGPGRCVRLWSPAEQQRRPAFDPPEILECDPLPIALQLAFWGSGLGQDLDWLTVPPAGPLAEARHLLRQLGALDPQGAITLHGQAMAQLGLPPRLAHMLVMAARHDRLELACALAVLISERDPLEHREVGSDLLARLDWLRGGRLRVAEGGGSNPLHRQFLRLQRHWQSRLQAISPEPAWVAATHALREPEAAALLLSWAYPDRLALARSHGGGRFVLRNGRGAALHPADPLMGAEALAIAAVVDEGADARIQLALPLSPDLLRQWTRRESHSEQRAWWDESCQKVRCERIIRLGALVLERQPWPEATDADVLVALLEWLRRQGLNALPWNHGSRQLHQRLVLAHRLLGDPWPDRSPQTLETRLEEWLGPYLWGIRSLQELQRVDLSEALWGNLDWQLRSELEEQLPLTMETPSGRRVVIDYTNEQPVLAVRVQDMFGCTDTPRLLGGRLGVQIHLLSPAGRPAAITSDLARFWREGYGEVRRQLRGRYPKHSWPEDPASAPRGGVRPPTRRTRNGEGPR